MHDILPRKRMTWQNELSQIITDPEVLIDILGLNPHIKPKAIEVSKKFPFRVTRHYLAKIKPQDIHDPLLKQILPLEAEFEPDPHYVRDPLKEMEFNPVPGILHKYKGRVLLTVTGHCAIHCRYCFRREFNYAENTPPLNAWAKAFDYIAKDFSISEVILSGGDPLTLKDKHLLILFNEIKKIPHIKRLRIHSRLPVVLPQRIDEEFLRMFAKINLAKILVLHINHPNEIDVQLQSVCNQLKISGVSLLNQSVLLNGVNDEASVLIALQEKLFDCGILPYYLHLPDKVQGTKHFFVAESKALVLIESLKAALPGYLVPKLVREKAYEASKSWV